jgi:hypothetical protein
MTTRRFSAHCKPNGTWLVHDALTGDNAALNQKLPGHERIQLTFGSRADCEAAADGLEWLWNGFDQAAIVEARS